MQKLNVVWNAKKVYILKGTGVVRVIYLKGRDPVLVAEEVRLLLNIERAL